ncbi:MAG: N-6 DNA methylase [Bacteroidaceae bacterium]|nr:N-6 DNA methylase [Bacteroidaceae bacterium]
MIDKQHIQKAKECITIALQMQEEHEPESRLRENFTSYLRLMFPADTKWVEEHIRRGEHRVKMERNNRKVSGFIDNFIASTAIEYEKNLTVKSIFDEGLRQVREYCATLVTDGNDKQIVQGVLSDTLNWYVYAICNDDSLAPSEYTQDNIELKEIARLHIMTADEESSEQLIVFLSKYLGRVGGRPLNAQSLALDFGLDSKFSAPYIENVVDYIGAQVSACPEYFKMIKDMWTSFTSIEKSSQEYIDSNETYSHEFYISLLAKLLCANFISKEALNSDDRQLIQIADGAFFENRGISNFAEHDCFGWLLNDNLQTLLPTIKAMQRDLSIYDFSRSQEEDLFGLIMVQLSEKSHRLLLGQELTPSWIAEKLVANVISMLPNGEVPMFVDMCCGSGSMVVATIKHINSFLGDDVEANKQVIQNCITGFDVDPLAVILAKINWIISVGTLLDNHFDMMIPIYHADSLFIHKPISEDNDNNLILKLFDKHVILPESLLADNRLLFDAIVNKCYDCIADAYNREEFAEIIAESLDVSDETTLNFASDLQKVMYDLNEEGKNGIWSFFLKNTMRPSLITAKFNGIVSNTPWLALSKLADNPYHTALNLLAKDLGIKPSDASFLHVELATIFLLSSIGRYLNENGVYGCVLPHSVLAGHHQQKFRTGGFAKSRMQIDTRFSSLWLLPESVFKNKAIVLFGTKESWEDFTSLPGMNIISKERAEPTVFITKQHGGQTIWTNEEVHQTVISSASPHFEQGADIMPRNIFFFNLEENGSAYSVSSITPNSRYAYYLQNMHKGRDYRIPPAVIPKRYFYKVLVSNIVTPFGLSEVPLALLPVKVNAGGIWQCLTDKHINAMPRPVKNTFNEIEREYKVLQGANRDIFRNALNWRGKLEKQCFNGKKFLVLFGAGGRKPCATYVKLDASDRYIVDQTLYWYATNSEDEALYLVGLLNSESITKLISPLQTEGLQGKRHIHTLAPSSIQSYDAENIAHKQLADITRQLIGELRATHLDTNPNSGTLQHRRSKIMALVEKLPSYQQYSDLCETVLLG